ncbi:MAG: hypothetical protein D3910_02815 [Candidatus Electrothrix sp. ATG2]|nr:hypothetical protein [Candidatus Electrothrix sp. ATG2]
MERTSILLHVIDAATKDEQPLQDYQVLAAELAAYNEILLDRTHLVALNKMDCIDKDRVEELRVLFQKNGIKVLTFSAKENIGIDKLKNLIGDLLEEQRGAAADNIEEDNEP